MLVQADEIPENPKEYYGVDKASGLIMAPGWETVKGQCNACHTSLIVAQNSGNREQWRETIHWMVDTQGLWDLPDTWDPVLYYLSTYYQDKGIDMNKYRRKPIDSAFDATHARREPMIINRLKRTSCEWSCCDSRCCSGFVVVGVYRRTAEH